MLPSGHIAAGYLISAVAVKYFFPQLPAGQVTALYWWGMLWAAAPDVDVLYSFVKLKAWTSDPQKQDHRQYLSHSPVLWLVPGLVVYAFAASDFIKAWALVFILASQSHFVLDSIEYGVPWLWPFSKRLIAIKDAGIKTFQNPYKVFFRHWLCYLKFYLTRLTFYFEVVIIVSALVIYFKS